MGDPAKTPDRIPLPPVVLSIVPWLAAGATMVAGFALLPQLGGVVILLIAIGVFAVTALWFARRVRRDDT
jgi:hypothetical protein